MGLELAFLLFCDPRQPTPQNPNGSLPTPNPAGTRVTDYPAPRRPATTTRVLPGAAAVGIRTAEAAPSPGRPHLSRVARTPDSPSKDRGCAAGSRPSTRRPRTAGLPGTSPLPPPAHMAAGRPRPRPRGPRSPEEGGGGGDSGWGRRERGRRARGVKEEERVPTGREGRRRAEEVRRPQRRRGGAGVYLGAEVRALDAQLDAGGTLELGLAAAAVRLAHARLHGRHAAWLLEERLTEEEEEEEERGQRRGQRPSQGRSSARGAWARKQEERRAGPDHAARPAPAPRAQLAPRPAAFAPPPPAAPASRRQARTWGLRGIVAETSAGSAWSHACPGRERTPGPGQGRPGAAGGKGPSCLAPRVSRETALWSCLTGSRGLECPPHSQEVGKGAPLLCVGHPAASWKRKVIHFLKFRFSRILPALRPKDHHSVIHKKGSQRAVRRWAEICINPPSCLIFFMYTPPFTMYNASNSNTATTRYSIKQFGVIPVGYLKGE